jgi:hypothetical protein
VQWGKRAYFIKKAAARQGKEGACSGEGRHVIVKNADGERRCLLTGLTGLIGTDSTM